MDILISGASTGIGRAIAIHFAASGHKVWAGVRSQTSFDELVKLKVKGLSPVFLDVTNSASIKDAVGVVKKQSGTLHALVNNAGIAVGGPVEGVTMAEWREQFDINFFGTIELTQACLPMLRETHGRVVNMSSLSGRVASPYLGPYAASKYALEAFSDSLRREMKPRGVKVSIIEPGAISTPIWKKSIAVGEKQIEKLSEEMRQVYGKSVDKFFEKLQEMGEGAAPVSLVVKAVEHALTAREPRSRYPVGRGIGFATRVTPVLPDRWMDRLMSRLT